MKKGGKHINQINEGTEIKIHRGSRTQGRGKNYSLLRTDFPTMETSYILKINKGGDIVSMTPYNQTQIRRTRQEWLELRLIPLLYSSFPLSLISHSPTMTCKNGH